MLLWAGVSLISLFRGDLFIEWEALSIGGVSVLMVLLIDLISSLFLFSVSLIAISVVFFRGEYISSEKYYGRFLFLVLAFVTRIFLLIASPNLISILLGWDGLGVTSYLLVVFYQRRKSYNAGIITAITNRLGDAGILVCVGLILTTGSWNFCIFSWGDSPYGRVIPLVILLARITKSAQIPFSAWLPAAIAAPTPVSALVHSSTLVTAGVYLLIRFHLILRLFGGLKYLALLGRLTIVMAGLGALFEIDLKKIIALSTLSQLGVIIITIGSGQPLLGFFHLLAHAYFKAMLFMCAGSVIHNIKDYQDIRLMGYRGGSLPLTLAILTTANLSLCGLPFMSGFYSKDAILENILLGPLNLTVNLILIVGTALTAAYSSRLTLLARARLKRGERIFRGLETKSAMLSRRSLLLVPALVGGLYLSWILFSSPSPVIFPPFLKRVVPWSVFGGGLTGVIWRLTNINQSLPSGLKWANSTIWFLPSTLRALLTSKALTSAKQGTLHSDLSWNEQILFIMFRTKASNRSNFNEKLLFLGFSQRALVWTLLIFVLLGPFLV